MNCRNDVLCRISEVQALPASAVSAIRKLDDPAANLNDVADCLKHDPGLTANILRLANSAVFGSKRQLGSLREAAMRLGAARLGQLILTAAMPSAARHEIKGYDLPSGRLLSAAMTTAFGMEEIASVLHIQLPPHAYTAALLADIGKIVLGTFIEVDAGPILEFSRTAHVPFDVAEREILGIDHAEVGGALLEHWNLPPTLSEIVRWHHVPESCPNPSETLDLVHLAAHLSMLTGQLGFADGLNYRLSESVVARRRLKNRELEFAMCRATARLEEAQRGI